jgi:hypothetical protein
MYIDNIDHVDYPYEQKTGEWINLGHIIGYCKHPYSEDHECSVCGYRYYVWGTFPPPVCPVCRAIMTNGVKPPELFWLKGEWDEERGCFNGGKESVSV